MAKFCVINCAVFLLIGQFILRTITGAFHETVRVTIKNGDENILLNWKQSSKYLANHNLPIWRARRNKDPDLIRDMLKNFGSFVMYQDVEKSSAVIYFDLPGCFFETFHTLIFWNLIMHYYSQFGIIDTRFYIDCLPLSEITPDKHHEVNGLYVKSRIPDQTQSFHDDLPAPSTSCLVPGLDSKYIHSMFDHILTSEVKSSRTDLSNENHQQDNILFAELLVFITNDRVRRYRAMGHDETSLVAYYLTYFNALDMLYAKLATSGVVIHINIAGLVFEDEPKAFSHLKFVTSENGQLENTLDAEPTLTAFQAYLRQYKHIFVEDSFDFFFLSTDYEIMRDTDRLSGVALTKLNIYEGRLDGYHDPLGLIVEHQSFYADFITSAHELAHAMDVDHDSSHGGRKCNNIQCFSILQQFGTYCRNCITWSEKSRREFQMYIRTNMNHCFLLNPPRSLHPYGTPISTITPHRQCTCYGYQSHLSTPDYLDAVGSGDCEKELTCILDDEESVLPTPEPVDGTPCDINKVCWQKQCRELPNQPSKENNESHLRFKNVYDWQGLRKK